MQFFVKDIDKTLTVNINSDLSAIYTLKCKICEKNGLLPEDQILTCDGKILIDADSIRESKIQNNSTLHISRRLKGGGTSFVVIMFMLMSMLFLSFLMLTGLLPLFAHMYYAVTNYGFNLLQKMMGSEMRENVVIKVLIFFGKILLFGLKYGVLYIAFYVLVSSVTVTTYYAKSGNFCDSYGYAKRTGTIIAIVFCVIYLLYNIPDILADLFGKGAKDVIVIGPWAESGSKAAKMSWDKTKLIPVTLIPVVGSGFSGYFRGINSAFDNILKGEEKVKELIDKMEEGPEKLNENINDDSFLRKVVAVLGMKNVIKMVEYSISTDETKKNHPEFKNFTTAERITARFTHFVFINILTAFRGLSWILAATCDMGPDEIEKQIKSLEKLKENTELSNSNKANINAQLKQAKCACETDFKMINPECMKNMTKSGCIAGVLSWISFVITWIIFMIRV